MSRVFPAISSSLMWLMMSPIVVANEPPVPPLEEDSAPAYSPIDAVPVAPLSRRLRPAARLEGPPQPPEVSPQSNAPPQRMATTLPSTNRIPRIEQSNESLPAAEAGVPGILPNTEPKQIDTYESTGAPDPFVDPAAPAEANRATPLEPLGRQTEVVRERYPNGAIKIERHVTQDENRNYLNHGPWIMWDTAGRVLAKGQFRLGNREGTWLRYYFTPNDGILRHPSLRGYERPLVSASQFSEGELHGVWLVVDAKERRVASWTFEHGKLHGEAVWWHPNGQPLRAANYNHGIPHGEFTEWRADGTITRQVEYQKGASFQPVVQNYPNGKPRVQGWHVNPHEVHHVTHDWWTGDVQIEVDRAEGQPTKTGVWTYFHANGMKEYEGEFQAGIPIGSHSWWYANGQRMIRGNYLDGRPHGAWTWWYANGQRRIEGSYIQGEADRGWIGWTEDGLAVSLDDKSDAIPNPPVIVDDPQNWSSARANDAAPRKSKIGYY